MASYLSIASIFVIIACALLAIFTLINGVQWLKPQPIKVRVSRTRNQMSGILLLSSAFAWALLGWQLYQSQPESHFNLTAVEHIESLPPTSSGIMIRPVDINATALNANQAADMAKIIADADEMTARPHGVNFQSLRHKVTRMLFSSEGFDQQKSLVNIDLSQDGYKEAIKYIVQERPGLLTIVYKQQTQSGTKMVVYFPEITGNQLIYTPLYGAGSEMPSVVKK